MQDLYSQLDTVEFIKEYLARKDWYMITRDLKALISENIPGERYDLPDVKISGKVHIGKNCKMGSYVVIEGPVYIGDDVEIGSFAHIRPGSVISDGCVIGYTAGIKNSVMLSGAKISNHAFLGDSVMFKRARLGGHAETGNRRFDQKEISWSFQNGKQETGLDKLGAIIGEDSRIGGGVMLAPGTVIGKSTFIASGAHVSGYIPAGKFVKSKAEIEIRDNNFNEMLNQESTLR